MADNPRYTEFFQSPKSGGRVRRRAPIPQPPQRAHLHFTGISGRFNYYMIRLSLIMNSPVQLLRSFSVFPLFYSLFMLWTRLICEVIQVLLWENEKWRIIASFIHAVFIRLWSHQTSFRQQTVWYSKRNYCAYPKKINTWCNLCCSQCVILYQTNCSNMNK